MLISLITNCATMKNAELIESTGREMFFTQIWLRCQDIAENLPGDINRLRLVVQTDSGHKLVELPMEQGDTPFMETVLRGVSNVAAAKSSVAHASKEMDGSI